MCWLEMQRRTLSPSQHIVSHVQVSAISMHSCLQCLCTCENVHMYVCMYVCMHACSVCEQDLHLWTLMSRLMLTCLPLQWRSTLLVSARLLLRPNYTMCND